jgi:hypothetical protein
MPYKDASVRKQKAVGYSRKYYEANREKTLVLNTANKLKHKQKWDEFKTSLHCANCNFSHPAALDFHHTDPSTKEHNVHKLIGNKQFKKAYEEIKKCIVLCANCHRIHHYEEKLIQSP